MAVDVVTCKNQKTQIKVFLITFWDRWQTSNITLSSIIIIFKDLLFLLLLLWNCDASLNRISGWRRGWLEELDTFINYSWEKTLSCIKHLPLFRVKYPLEVKDKQVSITNKVQLLSFHFPLFLIFSPNVWQVFLSLFFFFGLTPHLFLILLSLICFTWTLPHREGLADAIFVFFVF